MALELRGHNVVGIAIDGNEAISMFRNFPNKPDIIIMDYRMPGKNGLDAMKEILQLEHSPLFIFASADDNIREEAMSLGATSFKYKPFTIDYLCKNIEKALSTKS
ncbi:MAG: response regulator [Candidatus Lokiarchaeota archaeon]|nr:response regulator [Candidatus Lokiarchaeota archaeon]